jgi:hypothetical protein
MLQRNGVPTIDQDQLGRWSVFGLGTAPTAAQAAALTDALPALNTALRTGATRAVAARMVQRWVYPNPAIGTYGNDHGLRAAVALSGLGALPPAEAVYLNALTDSSGQPLHGHHRYRVKFPPQGIGAQAFWSLSMYQIEADGRLFFIDNPLKRYAVGNRTAGLVKQADGSMALVVQAQEPADAVLKANWLPAPGGPFRLSLRAYLPSPALASGEAPLPVVERLP